MLELALGQFRDDLQMLAVIFAVWPWKLHGVSRGIPE